MELPKNITQIGEVNRNTKIYVEDYVISYMKQLNQKAVDKNIAVALYGVKKTEGSISFYFVYGAAKLNFLQKELRHLSQAQKQEIETGRRKYFQEFEFVGYRILNGEMIDGFHICEQEICRYIGGYAQFYEKNDSMLAYMVDTREQQEAPEQVDEQKYEVVKKRQEERREQYLEKGNRTALRAEKDAPEMTARAEAASRAQMRKFRMSAAVVFVLLGVAGLTMLLDGSNYDEVQGAVKQVMSELTEQKLPGDSPVSAPLENKSELAAEETLEEAIREENAVMGQAATQAQEVEMKEPVREGEAKEPAQEVQGEIKSEIPEKAELETSTKDKEETSEREEAKTEAQKEYVIRKGDTLIAISKAYFGSDASVESICKLNGISNPDDIKVGQKILLPY